MRERNCHYCGQKLPEVRLGVKLSPLKARIVDFVMRAGDDGILVADLCAFMKLEHRCLRSHVHQINEAIIDSGYRFYTRAKTVFLIYGAPPRTRWWRK
jgi:hypothetical protein